MSKYVNFRDDKNHILAKLNRKENTLHYKKISNKLKIFTLHINKKKPIINDKENNNHNTLTDIGNLTFQHDTKRKKLEKQVKTIINKIIKKEKPKEPKNNQLPKITKNNNIIKLQKKLNIINPIKNKKVNISSIPLFNNYIQKTLTSHNSLNKSIKNKYLVAQRTFSICSQNNTYRNYHTIRNSVLLNRNNYTDANITQREKTKSADISPKQMKKINKNNKNTQEIISLKNNSMIVGRRNKKRAIIKLTKHNINKIKDEKNKKFNFEFAKKFIINKNPQIVEEYLDDIYKYLKSIENLGLPKENYMKIIQKDINEKMRKVLIDWLVDVHAKFKLLPETLFLTINIMDRYLSKTSINRKNFQLLGVTAMFLASKYEDIYPPEIKEFIFMTDNAYKNEELIKLESDILDNIEFNMTFPTSLRFLEIYKTIINLKEIDFYRCRYFIEIALFNYNCCHFSPRLIAASSIYLNFKLNKNKSKYIENKILKEVEYDLKEMNPCLNCLIYGIKQMSDSKNKYTSIRRKFEKEEYMKVSKEKIDFNIFFDILK